LRAIGDVLRDQLFYLQRVWASTRLRRARTGRLKMLMKGLSDFSEVYQTSFDQKLPLFRRVQRKANSPAGIRSMSELQR
jgi:uncharacterized protein (DUF934 family)